MAFLFASGRVALERLACVAIGAGAALGITQPRLIGPAAFLEGIGLLGLWRFSR